MTELVPQLPTVSLCTITHNRRHLLPLLMECVIAQDYPAERLEWVVVDDSTHGDPPDFSRVREAGISVVDVALDTRLPIGAKRNLCHERSSGEVLVLFDDDDYYPRCRVREAVEALADDVAVVGCSRLPLLLLPEGSRWLTPFYGPTRATANTLAYRRSYVEAGHHFDPDAEKAEEASFLEEFTTPLRQLDPFRTLTCIGHGSNTVDKRLWIARNGQQLFESLPQDAAGFPPAHYLRRYRQALGLPDATPAATAQVEDHDPAPQRAWRVAVVTPYHNEPVEVLRRCHESVLAQTVPCTHVLVADGPGHAEVAGWDCRHIVLGVGHADNGNTPRSLGGLAAMNEGFDAIAFLDADNWFAPEHLERAIATQQQGDWEVVFSGRHIVFPDGRRLTCLPEEERTRRHVDTSCIVLFAPAFSTLALWAQMPRLFAPQCDRVAFAQLMASHRCGWSEAATVFFESWYAGHFLAAGLLPPSNAKFPHRHPEAAWDEAATAFRQRCPTPVYVGREGIGPEKPRINLVSILGPARSGGTLLQSQLCRYLSFFGIPENHFLFQFIACFGPDPVLRRDGAELRLALAEHRPQHPLVKANDLEPRGLDQAIKTDRSYTLLEAWFRAVQALTPKEAMAFSRAYGAVNVLERSCTLPLVADVLFRSLPQHQAVLMVRDPLEQIAATRRMMAHYPEAWRLADGSLSNLCDIYLQSLAIPLAAAPVGQLKLVSFSRLVQCRAEVLEEVSGFLGLAPNPFLALEPMDLPEKHVFNMAQPEAWRERVEELPGQLLHEEPWKLGCFECKQQSVEGDGEELLNGSERQALDWLFAPVRQAIACMDEQDSPEPQDFLESAQSESNLHHLVDLARQVAEGLARHGSRHEVGTV
ncbi:glycosyltransferase [Synechococcus sp. BSF8S]|uniref:glycosyltransferase family 2 protein n=1 Tax=Synechococcales TaxID=1890424 RepID=UPI00162A6399|nr:MULTISPECIES: glycosyltransferase family 2 protein [unclassified Synechococcus]MBC1262505.1 glycosyltransferase [Synechococcus sp. BSF8S]MBC1265387.1 glycosyltransferase [Synechococcus sp. BSA11S]